VGTRTGWLGRQDSNLRISIERPLGRNPELEGGSVRVAYNYFASVCLLTECGCRAPISGSRLLQKQGCTLNCVRIRLIARAHVENVGSQFLSLRQLHLTKHSLPARQRAKNFNKHRYYSANLCTVRLALRSEIRSLRPFFSKALYFTVLVRNL